MLPITGVNLKVRMMILKHADVDVFSLMQTARRLLRSLTRHCSRKRSTQFKCYDKKYLLG